MASEKDAALAAVPSGSPTIFDKIINKEIPANIVYEDDKAAEKHTEILGRLLYTSKLVAKQEGLEDGFRLVINDGPKGSAYLIDMHGKLLHSLCQTRDAVNCFFALSESRNLQQCFQKFSPQREEERRLRGKGNKKSTQILENPPSLPAKSTQIIVVRGCDTDSAIWSSDFRFFFLKIYHRHRRTLSLHPPQKPSPTAATPDTVSLDLYSFIFRAPISDFRFFFLKIDHRRRRTRSLHPLPNAVACGYDTEHGQSLNPTYRYLSFIFRYFFKNLCAYTYT
ncbi:UNVERIFIED_CONTAM: Adenylylsulfatase HINT1 [Sesamum indicum]